MTTATTTKRTTCPLATPCPGLMLTGWLGDLAARIGLVRPPAPPPAPEADDDPGPDASPEVRAEVDPANPEARLMLTRRLLAGAIARYEAASLEWAAVHESFPHLQSPRAPSFPDEYAEWHRWRRLLDQADETFDNAELNLAERIMALFDMLRPEGMGADVEPGGYFVPRAVRSGGNIYVLAYSAWECEAKTNIIACYRESMVIDLTEVIPVL